MHKFIGYYFIFSFHFSWVDLKFWPRNSRFLQIQKEGKKCRNNYSEIDKFKEYKFVRQVTVLRNYVLMFVLRKWLKKKYF
jgi:hypothetical protein